MILRPESGDSVGLLVKCQTSGFPLSRLRETFASFTLTCIRVALPMSNTYEVNIGIILRFPQIVAMIICRRRPLRQC